MEHQLKAQGSKEKTPSAQLPASSFQLPLCEHLQKPHNAGSRPQAQFFNTLLCLRVRGRTRQVMAVETLATTTTNKRLAFIRPCAGDLKRPPALRAFQRQPRAHVLPIIAWHLSSFPAGRNPRTGAGCSSSFSFDSSKVKHTLCAVQRRCRVLRIVVIFGVAALTFDR
jgi:hypothetical protein